VAVLPRIYAKCISGHDAEAKRRILQATKRTGRPLNKPKKGHLIVGRHWDQIPAHAR